MAEEFKYEISQEFGDNVIDEKGNVYMSLRKIKWGNSDNYKLDLRKYYSTENGERMNKGVSFLTDDGPNELTRMLLEKGYGNPKDIVDTITQFRKDILTSLTNNINGDNVDNEDEMYDPREVLSE